MTQIERRKIILAAAKRKYFPKAIRVTDVCVGISVLILTGVYTYKTIINIVPAAPTKIIEYQTVLAAEPAQVDLRVSKLTTFLVEQNSPLAEYASYIVSEADRVGVDYTMIVSLSAIESQYGRKALNGTYNAWGIMTSTNGKRHVRRFASWNEGITFVSELMANRYKKAMYRAIKESYCPASDGCNSQWVEVVHGASQKLIAVKP